MRLSFRLDKDGEEVWLKLRERHGKRTDTWIQHKLLREEGYRLQGNTKDDMLKEIKALLIAIQAQIKEQDARALLQQLLERLPGENS